MDTILITGVSGYIGSNLADLLLERKFNLIGIDNRNNSRTNYLCKRGLSFFQGNICDTEFISTIFAQRKINQVVHLAALKSVVDSEKNRNQYYLNNVFGTRNIAAMSTVKEVSNFIFISSAAVYGSQNTHIVHEETECNPNSYYGETKLISERELNSISQTSTNFHCLRLFNVVGTTKSELSDDSKDNIIPRFIDCIKNNIQPTIFGQDFNTSDGTALRDYVDIKDVINAILALISNKNKRKQNTILNVGSGKGTSVLEVLEILQKYNEKLVIPKFGPRRVGDVEALIADISQLRKLLGVEPNLNLQEIVSRIN